MRVSCHGTVLYSSTRVTVLQKFNNCARHARLQTTDLEYVTYVRTDGRTTYVRTLQINLMKVHDVVHLVRDHERSFGG